MDNKSRDTKHETRAALRFGIGFDAHRLAKGRPLMLGGVEIPFPRGLEGHSDGDALAHAVCDALLGAAGLPDIGTHFPPGDDTWRGVSGVELLRRVAAMLREKGLKPVQVDTIVIAEAPRIAPHAEKMRKTISEALGIGESDVGVKATTTEGMGFTGRGEGIAAHAVALVGIAGG